MQEGVIYDTYTKNRVKREVTYTDVSFVTRPFLKGEKT